MAYSPFLVKPKREELTALGFEELTTAEEVDAWPGKSSGTGFVVINSVCSSAAGIARPGVRLALEGRDKGPDHLASVFAGQDVEATAALRALMWDLPPSSPAMALFKDGERVFFLPSHRIQGHTREAVAEDLGAAFNEHCG